MLFILVTLLVPKSDISNVVNLLHPLNIYSIFVHRVNLKLLISKDSNELHPLNIFSQVIAFSVLKVLKFKLFKFGQLSNSPSI